MQCMYTYFIMISFKNIDYINILSQFVHVTWDGKHQVACKVLLTDV